MIIIIIIISLFITYNLAAYDICHRAYRKISIIFSYAI